MLDPLDPDDVMLREKKYSQILKIYEEIDELKLELCKLDNEMKLIRKSITSRANMGSYPGRIITLQKKTTQEYLFVPLKRKNALLRH